MVRVWITGASGFIGSRVTRLALEAGAEVGILALPDDRLERLADFADRLTVLRGELGSVEIFGHSLRQFMPETCLHLAWSTEPGKYLESELNDGLLAGSLALQRCLVQAGCQHVVMVGTCAEYDTALGFLTEESATRPATRYAAAKHALHLNGDQIAAETGMGFTWARLFYLFGPGEHPMRLVPSVIRALLAGKDFLASRGTQVRDYLYVEDVAAALWHLAVRRLPGAYNVSSGIPLTVKSLLDMVSKIIGGKGRIRYGSLPDRDWEPEYICGGNAKLVGTGWTPRTALREGLERTVEWWACQAAP